MWLRKIEARDWGGTSKFVVTKIDAKENRNQEIGLISKGLSNALTIVKIGWVVAGEWLVGVGCWPGCQ